MPIPLGWAFLEASPNIRIRNIDSGETRVISADDEIPGGWYPVFGADVSEPLPAASTTAAAWWVTWAIILVMAVIIVFSRDK